MSRPTPAPVDSGFAATGMRMARWQSFRLLIGSKPDSLAQLAPFLELLLKVRYIR
jgi:hypothetical protein